MSDGDYMPYMTKIEKNNDIVKQKSVGAPEQNWSEDGVTVRLHKRQAK